MLHGGCLGCRAAGNTIAVIGLCQQYAAKRQTEQLGMRTPSRGWRVCCQRFLTVLSRTKFGMAVATLMVATMMAILYH